MRLTRGDHAAPDDDDCARICVPAAEVHDASILLVQAVVETFSAGADLAGELVRDLSAEAAALGEPRSDQLAVELGVAFDERSDELQLSAARAALPAGTQSAGRIELHFDGPLFLQGVLPRALAVLGRLSRVGLGRSADLALLGSRLAADLSAPELPMLRIIATPSHDAFVLTFSPLPRGLGRRLAELIETRHRSAAIDLGPAGSEGTRLAALIPARERMGATT